ncbi:MAG: methionyl-tRNA formyltransferase [Candidatus Kapaibacterium sp.]
MSERKHSIVFMGTPEFAVPALEKIHSEFDIKAVVTVPDKPRGRGRKPQAPAVKQKAVELGLEVLQPEKLKDPEFVERLREIAPDIICVIAFRILPKEVYTIPALGSFNVHGSLLPAYRGAAPINWAIINGEKKTGLTSFLLKEKVDTGDILLRKEIAIPDGCTAGGLHDMMMAPAADLAADTTRLLINGNYKTLKQDDSQASPAPKIFREQCEINWQMPAEELRNFIHGVSPVPGAWTVLNGAVLKVFRVSLCPSIDKQPGEFTCLNNRLLVQCADKSLALDLIKPEGRKSMPAGDFLCGYRGEPNGKMG